MKFRRLRLNGFKSFVEATELLIEPGLTGIVGPNGCGKSNVVEGLRWAMGETSAKQLRGGDMYDVIFAGSANRSARNVADVTITLDNALRQAPEPFNDTDELVISRRIERDKGSVYRINGRDVRARDVQLLFADAATGARSPALVSQGKIGALINAKPAERRVLLEDAAGIGGLHARRHEAELKLKQAEANLERLDDVLTTMETQVNSLMRQVRQAVRYRELSEEIKKLDALRHHIRWVKAKQDIAAAQSNLNQSQTRVAEAAQAATAADTARAHAAADLPALRQADAEAGAAETRLQYELDQLTQDQARLLQARAEMEERIAQLDGDLTREQRLANDAHVALERVQEEVARLGDGSAIETEQAAAQLAARVDSLQQTVDAAQAQVDAQTEAVAQLEARQHHLTTRLDQTRQLLSQSQDKARRAVQSLAELGGDDSTTALMAQEQVVESAEAAVQAASAAETTAVHTLEQTRQQHQATIKAASEAADSVRSDNTRRDAVARAAVEQARRDSRQDIETARAGMDQTRTALVADVEARQTDLDAATATCQSVMQDRATLQAEAEALQRVLAGDADKQGKETAPAGHVALVTSLTVQPGYEAALGVVLGEAASAGILSNATTWTGQGWDFTEPTAPLNNEMADRATLADVVELATEAVGLRRVLSRIGLVADRAEGGRLAAALLPGQALVSQDGTLWRWDGYRSDGADHTAAAEVLRQKNRLAVLLQDMDAMVQTEAEAEAELTAARDACLSAQTILEEHDAQVADDLQAMEQQATAAEDAAHGAWDTVRTENSAREAEAIMAVRHARQSLETAEQDGRAHLAELRSAVARAQATERQARNDHRQLLEQVSALMQQRATLEEAERTATAETQRLTTQLSEAAAEAAALPDRDEALTRLEEARQHATEARQQLAQVTAEHQSLADSMRQRAAQLARFVQEQADWHTRHAEATQHVQTLTARLADSQKALADLADQPETASYKRGLVAQKLEEAVAARALTAQALTAKEEEAVTLERSARLAQDTLQSMRESHVRADATLEQTTAHLTDVLERIEADLAIPPTELARTADVSGDPDDMGRLPSLKQAEIDLDRVKRQRDAIGPVNLRAEVELQEVEQQFANLRDEKTDLLTAIERLRAAIEEINTEGRARLLKAFELVNSNFSTLFMRLFGGGTAHLDLIENEDPLAAGLEVMASPPGKKLQTMSLLSGGEQALTALSLLFAVFLVNPAPICVLDEVDAPLDDANVERFCNLLDQMAQYRSGDLETRFLVVSHHPLTMARMNRLFGVTMSERGVSTLVSVDLEQADSIRIPAA